MDDKFNEWAKEKYKVNETQLQCTHKFNMFMRGEFKHCIRCKISKDVEKELRIARGWDV